MHLYLNKRKCTVSTHTKLEVQWTNMKEVEFVTTCTPHDNSRD